MPSPRSTSWAARGGPHGLTEGERRGGDTELAVILAADVAGYSKLAGADEERNKGGSDYASAVASFRDADGKAEPAL